MMRLPRSIIISAVAAVLGLAILISTLPSSSFASFNTFSVGGNSTAGSIQATVDAFRAALSNPNNGNASGPLAGGRREINWDGGGTVTTVSPTPFAGFQNIRGALFVTPGTGFAQVPQDQVDDLFSNPSYAGEFSTFSPVRLFTPMGSNITDVTFFIPGSNGLTPATVGGFGAVFTDVDLPTSTQLEFFGLSNQPLFSALVPAGTVPDGSLSFLGALGNAGERIGRVRITSGTTAPGPNDTATSDIVLMDDFLYAEPQSVPEPATIGLLAIGLTVLAISRKRAT